MKKLSLLFLFFAILFISACEDDNSTDPSDNNDSFTAMKGVVQNMMMEMDTMSMTMDPDYDFAKMMISHHQGAIDMANILIEKGHHDTLKLMAQEMINSQTNSIDMLEDYISTHTPTPITDTMYMMQMHMGMQQMKDSLNAHTSHGDTDSDFCSFMIHHHQEAIDMAQLVIDYGDDTEMISEAQKTKDEQQQEIKELQEFLDGHGH